MKKNTILSPELISTIMPTREEIVMNHSVFMQCFLPIRSLPKEQEQYSTVNGKITLTVQAGSIYTKANMILEKMEVPAGAKARLILNYINHYAYYHKTDTVHMGKSLNQFMLENNIPVGGQNLKELRRQVRNVAAANIIIGLWREDGQIETRFSKIVSGIVIPEEDTSFTWSDTIQLDRGYIESLREHGVPADMRILAALSKNPRAMDLYSWLTYRSPGVKYPLKIPYTVLHEMFGQGIKSLRHFKEEFKKSLKEVFRYYDTVNIDITDKDYVTLFRSEPSVPRETYKIKY